MNFIRGGLFATLLITSISHQLPGEEAEADDYEQLCQIMGSEVLKRIPPPFPESRLAYYQEKEGRQAELIPRGPENIYFRWDEGKLKRWGMSFGGANLSTVLRMLTELYPQEIVGDKELKGINIPGDFIVNVKASREDVVRRLEQILNEDMELNLSLAFREIEQDVYVARGEYKFTAINEDRKQVEIYGDKLNSDSSVGGGGSGDFNKFLEWVGMWIEQPIVSEVESPPSTRISWHYNLEGPFTDEERRRAKDPESVLNNLNKQTGLEFTREKRKVRMLALEQLKAPK